MAEEEQTPKASGTSKRKLTGLLINKPLVKRYVLLIVVIMMVASLLIGFVISQTLKGYIEKQASRSHKVSVIDILMDVNNDLLIRVFFILFLAVIATGVAGILFLHRIAGPVYRFKGVITALADGKIPKHDIVLREGDFFVDVATELNRLMARLRSSK